MESALSKVEYLHLDRPECLSLHSLYKYWFTFHRWRLDRISCYRLIHMYNRWSIRIMMHLRKGVHLMFGRSLVIGPFLVILIVLDIKIVVAIFSIIYLLLLFRLACFRYFLFFGTFFILSLGLRVSIIKR